MDPSQLELPLKDIHLPPPVGWWPPAPGWWLLSLALCGLGYAAFRSWRRLRQPNIRRLGLRELAKLEDDKKLSPLQKAQQLSMLLRRAALTVYPREQIAGLQGRDWLEWLEGVLADGRFTDGPGQALVDAPYRPELQQPEGLEALFVLCRDWLQRLPAPR